MVVIKGTKCVRWVGGSRGSIGEVRGQNMIKGRRYKKFRGYKSFPSRVTGWNGFSESDTLRTEY